jgi:hypothetical protein
MKECGWLHASAFLTTMEEPRHVPAKWLEWRHCRCDVAKRKAMRRRELKYGRPNRSTVTTTTLCSVQNTSKHTNTRLIHGVESFFRSQQLLRLSKCPPFLKLPNLHYRFHMNPSPGPILTTLTNSCPIFKDSF